MTDNSQFVSHVYRGTYVPPDWWPVPGLLYQFEDADGPWGRCLPYNEWDGAPGMPTAAVFVMDDGRELVVDLPSFGRSLPVRALSRPPDPAAKEQQPTDDLAQARQDLLDWSGDDQRGFSRACGDTIDIEAVSLERAHALLSERGR